MLGYDIKELKEKVDRGESLFDKRILFSSDNANSEMLVYTDSREASIFFEAFMPYEKWAKAKSGTFFDISAMDVNKSLDKIQEKKCLISNKTTFWCNWKTMGFECSLKAIFSENESDVKIRIDFDYRK